MSKILFIALSLALLALTKGDHPISWYREFQEDANDEFSLATDNAEKVYRLPENVIPLEYDIYINLFFDERTENPYSFDGDTHIIITTAEQNVNQIVLHANVDTVHSAEVVDSAGTRLASTHSVEQLYHFLKIDLEQPLQANTNYTLSITYSNTMNEGPVKRGIWRGWYTDADGKERIYAATHFQPYNARQAFPCWDEPLFKAVFKLHISRPIDYVGTFSNTESVADVAVLNERMRTDFAATPKMSSYLVTFLVSETFTVIAEDRSFDPPIRIIGRSNTVGLGDHALDLTVKMTQYFDEYFEIPYRSLHPNLVNDHISSPDWASAGTENWGMVSYRELYMVIDKDETVMSNEHYAATLVSHELAHKWFGNLITCYWWSNTWINEGYASYFGYMATHQMFPEYEFPDHFNSRYLQTSLAFDSSVNTVPLNHDVNTPAQVTGHFGTISYSKAASFLRMTSNIMSLDTFRKSCQIFLLNNMYEATDQYDLLEAMVEAIDQDNSLADYTDFSFAEYYQIWVNVPGYPILEVEINHSTGEIKLSQERFFLSTSATPSNQVYPIPITYASNSNRNFTNLKPIHIMTKASETLTKNSGEEWVIFNNLQNGHYRVNYDQRTWNLIGEALRTSPQIIHYLTRGQIVDDVFALMRSERMEYDFGFNILRFLALDSNLHVLEPAISGYSWLRNRLRHIPESQKQFDAYILSQFAYAISTLGYVPAANETPTVTMARQSVLHFACALGHEGCVKDSWDRFVDLRDNNVPINSRVRRNVYVTAMREGNATDFDFLLKRYRESNFANDQLEILRGLGAAKTPELVTRYLEFTLTKEVRAHDKLNSFNYALLGNPENAKTVLEFVKTRIDDIRNAYIEDSPANPVHSCLSNLASYLDEPELADYENWLQTSQSHIPQYNTALNAITSARANMAWGTANAEKLLTATKASATTVMTPLVMVITIAVSLLFA